MDNNAGRKIEMTRYEESVQTLHEYGSQYAHSHKVQHAAWHKWLTELKFDYFVTLTFNLPPEVDVNLDIIDEKMRKLAHHATCETYGKNGYKGDDYEVVIFYFPERNKAGKWHVHALMHRPTINARQGKRDLPRYIRRRWCFLTGARVSHVKKLWNESDYSDVASYCLKDTKLDKDMARTTKRPSGSKISS